MAGIGFELRRLVETRTISGFAGAAFSGVVIVAGPWILTILSLSAAQSLPFFAEGEVALAFTGAMVWTLAASLCLSAGFLHIFVRLSADLIYEGKRAEAACLLVKVAAATAAVSLPIGWALASLLIANGAHAMVFRLGFALLLAAANVLWAAMMTVTAIKRYGLVLAAYAAGMGLMYWLAALLGPALGAAGALLGLAAGYAATAIILIAAALGGLGLAPLPGAAARLAAYGRRYRHLALTGAAYALGTWIDKFLLWGVRGSRAEGTWFSVYPPYDNAFFLANLALIPGLIYFTISTETGFSLDLRRFLGFLAHRRRPEVEAARRRLGRSARSALAAQSGFQAVVSVALSLLGPYITACLGAPAGAFLLLLWGGFFQLILLTALNMLFYLELYAAAAITGLCFLGVNALISGLIAFGPAPIPLGLPYLAAG
ncbi:MAG TPA: exopolysaccharide Pel transporter PelG, partial [Rectinemataceae bacterium]|nr:exopolysaccharide Pel transporter PelG [Rectinemataceae bacterium]